MIAKLTFLCLCLSLAAGMVRRDAPPPSSPLQDIEKHAAEFQKTFGEQIKALANSKNTQDLTKALKEGSDSVLQQLSTLSASLQGALVDANGKAKEALEQARTQIERTTSELKAAHPEVEQQAAALQKRIEDAVKQGVQHTSQLAKELQANAEEAGAKLQPKVKAAYDDFVKQTEQLQKKLHEAATAKQ